MLNPMRWLVADVHLAMLYSTCPVALTDVASAYFTHNGARSGMRQTPQQRN
jgi:hypothetical protein